jgi:hypothetical protein
MKKIHFPDTIWITINSDMIDTSFGTGIELHISPSEIQFNPQEISAGKQVPKIPRNRSFWNGQVTACRSIGKSKQSKFFH